MTSFNIQGLVNARNSLEQFRKYSVSPYHERYSFPFLLGTYFAYRKIDVLRVVSIAKAISDEPKYVDVGCGYGDFLKKVRELLPDAIGIEKETSIFYLLGMTRPNYIYPCAIEWSERKRFDMAYVGWMDHGVDFRRFVAKSSKCVLTTFDSGGQCGVNGECEYDEFGLHRIAWWKTPSWIDVNTELMNMYYTPSLKIDEPTKCKLSALRTAHNLWYLYAKPEVSEEIINALKRWLTREEQVFAVEKFDFESILDECGFYYMKHLPTMASKDKRLWELIIGY